MAMLEAIASAWSWRGVKPAEIVMQNAFGNVVFKDRAGAYWRICPEELSCDVIAGNDAEFERILADEEFILDWEMIRLVHLAEAKLGPVAVDGCYCLKIPAILGGQYAAENLGIVGRLQLIAFAGDIARQIDGLPNGSKVRLRIVD